MVHLKWVCDKGVCVLEVSGVCDWISQVASHHSPCVLHCSAVYACVVFKCTHRVLCPWHMHAHTCVKCTTHTYNKHTVQATMIMHTHTMYSNT